jgi:carboxylate-amine ligase
MTTTKEEERAARLGHALNRLAADLVTERSRNRTLLRENEQLRAEVRRLPAWKAPAVSDRGAWARWNGAPNRRYTVGVEEEVLLLDPADHALSQSSDAVLASLSDELRDHTAAETHAGVIELVTGVHATASDAVGELAALRRRLAAELRPAGLVAACAGTHPLAATRPTRVADTERHRVVAESLRFLAYREPTLALHVHVGIPDAEDATRVLNRLRETVPLLLALSANSPFCQGSDTGFESARTVIFGGFPRTGAPRAFTAYAEYVDAIDVLIGSGAIPAATFLWWDVRLQPQLGTVEVRVMDAQSSVLDSAPLVALVQSLARLELEEGATVPWTAAEVLSENRFLAARDGSLAMLVDPVTGTRVPVRELVAQLLHDCRPHAAALGCAADLEGLGRLMLANGAARQRHRHAQGGDVPSVVSALVEAFVPAHPPQRSDKCVVGLPTPVHPSC